MNLYDPVFPSIGPSSSFSSPQDEEKEEKEEEEAGICALWLPSFPFWASPRFPKKGGKGGGENTGSPFSHVHATTTTTTFACVTSYFLFLALVFTLTLTPSLPQTSHDMTRRLFIFPSTPSPSPPIIQIAPCRQTGHFPDKARLRIRALVVHANHEIV